MDNISIELIKDITKKITSKHGQDEIVATKITKWIESLMNGTESIERKEDVHDRLRVILKDIEVTDED